MKSLIFWMAFQMMAMLTYAQFSISGKIVSAQSGEPLVGANIILRQTAKGTSSDMNGYFEIKDIEGGKYVLVISYLGFQTLEKEIEVDKDTRVDIALIETALAIEGVVVEATRVTENSPTAHVTLNRKDLIKTNLGQDFPYLLGNTPGVVAFSDAGGGVGYSGLRIRGSDPTRVNVTINGIPLNDSESQAVFWVDLPDFASSVQSVQIQRGVGTSTNGSGAFGASINIETGISSDQPVAQLDNSFGTFNTRKHTLTLGTGLIRENINLNVRLSEIASDGYIDRATSLLRSFFVTGSYHGKRSNLKFNIFSGKEITYQAWDGVSESDLENNRTFNGTGQIGPNSFYDNQVDDYKQNHYQLHFNFYPLKPIELAFSLHYTKGFGFFEQYRADDVLSDYGLNDVILGGQSITSTDLIRRRWLDNDFYGTTFSAIYKPASAMKLTFGGSLNRYNGNHFGEIIWAQYASNSTNTGHYYDNTGVKDEYNIYLKPEFNLSSNLFLFGDIQFRSVSYSVDGIDNDQRMLDTDKKFNFLNPKFGISYSISPNSLFYASYSHGNREPDRNDFIDSQDGLGPKHESLNDYEAGFRFSTTAIKSELNLYSMHYINQLVLTGELNDVGSPIRRNVDKSHRTGAEISLTWNITEKWQALGNMAVSLNRIKEFNETVPIFDPMFNYLRDSVITYKDTEIILSPSMVAFGQVMYKPVKGFEIAFNGKYVSEQYLDNKSSSARKLNAFLVNNLNLSYAREFENAILRNFRVSFLINNLFDIKYEPNGYSYFILFDDGNSVAQENFNYYYPQAGINFLAGISVSF